MLDDYFFIGFLILCCTYYASIVYRDRESFMRNKIKKEIDPDQKYYNINQVIGMIEEAKIAIPIEEMFDDEGKHITKKKYGQILLKYLCKELKERY